MLCESSWTNKKKQDGNILEAGKAGRIALRIVEKNNAIQKFVQDDPSLVI